jgi:alpha-tubulin suppressor-like RCC1 family protein
MACGGEFSIILDITGGIFSFGNPEYGQLGERSDAYHLFIAHSSK